MALHNSGSIKSILCDSRLNPHLDWCLDMQKVFQNAKYYYSRPRILHRLRNKFLELILIPILLPGNCTSPRAECVGQ